ncbi:FGGY family carbohydrate kinase [Treponema parvum]|uniref:FGGY family carbohydrate kinase n=1 Tax=Treponema parvum TaxID=138851 RepID=UPI001AEC5EDB|nr:FGGY family carbohydrate kinase [Treponema parvum]QTQ16830.1 carbohydrate kinase [Treponema parvum]
MEYAVAVIDIGMTNKKVAVYDAALKQLDAAYKTFEPQIIKNPVTGQELKTHNLGEMQKWFFEQIRLFAKKYPIKAIAVSAHGATFVCTDKEGRVCAPCIFYTEEPGTEFQNEFYALAGTKEDLQKSTFSPAFDAMINLAKGIFYLKKYFPAEFAKTNNILFYPQYWGFLLTGAAGVEPTYAGCHTYLWDHKIQSWSDIAEKLGIKNLLPPKYAGTCSILGTLTKDAAKELELSAETYVTMGIHDSNASILPYLIKESGNDFVLNSTGTWCVSMHPQDSLELYPEDLGKTVFFNQSAFGNPIKTSIFLGGMEFDTWINCYKNINATQAFPSYTEEEVNKLFKDCDTFVLPEILPSTGQFTGSKPGISEKGKFYSLKEIQSGKNIPKIIKNEKAFFAALNASLVIQTETALRRSGLKPGTKIFTEGGFRKNKLYNSLLSSALRENKTFRTSMEEATAAGAAITAIMAATKQTAEELSKSINIKYMPDIPGNFIGYDGYKKRWLELVQRTVH